MTGDIEAIANTNNVAHTVGDYTQTELYSRQTDIGWFGPG